MVAHSLTSASSYRHWPHDQWARERDRQEHEDRQGPRRLRRRRHHPAVNQRLGRPLRPLWRRDSRQGHIRRPGRPLARRRLRDHLQHLLPQPRKSLPPAYCHSIRTS